MIARTHPLWTRLQSFEFDTGSPALTFAQRLAREQHWTQDFALRVIEEYRRFLFLAGTLKHPVTPSQQVDEAWHLHLTYTRSYWERLCPQVLQRSLHHDPTRGGTAEGEKFVDWYERTLNAYRETFDQEPPGDIWPNSKARFAPVARSPESATVTAAAGLVPPRSNTDYWMIPKPSRQRSLTTVACGLGTLLIGGCTPLVLGTNRSSMALILALAAFAVTAVIILLVAAFHRNNGRQSSGCSTSSRGCSGFIDGSGGHHGHGHNHGGGHHGHGSGHDGHGGHGGDAGSHGGGDGGAGCSGGSDGGGGGDGGGGCGGGGD